MVDTRMLGILVWIVVQYCSATPLLRGTYPNFHWGGSCNRPGSRCVVTDSQYGAVGDGWSDDTIAVQRAIDTCGSLVDAAGGHSISAASVVLPSGHRFVTGALNLTSGVDLVVEPGATLLGSTNPLAYPVVPKLPGYPTCRDNNYPLNHGYARHQALISGWNLANTSVCGGGIIDGQGLVGDPVLGTSWVDRFKAKTLSWGRPRLWEPMFSKDVAMFNITVINQAFWALHPYASTRVYIGHVNVTAPRDEGIPNDDGIDPDSSSDVLVERCYVSVGDNSVAIKSGMDLAGRAFAHPSFNLVFRESTFASETFAIGSEMSGSVFNVTVDNCDFGGFGSDFSGVHLKSERGRGGAVYGIRLHNLVFHSESSWKQPCPFSASLFYSDSRGPTNASATPHFYDVALTNISVHLPVGPQKPKTLKPAFNWVGLPESKMQDFRFRNITVAPVPPGSFAQSWGWSCTDVSGFSFDSVSPPPEPSSKCLGTASAL